MKLLLIYLLVVALLSARATRRGRRPRTWPLLIASVMVGAAFLSYRVV